MIREPLCFGCVHLKEWPYCAAFPDGIPRVVRDGEDLHLQHIDGDHGLKFEPNLPKEARGNK